MFIQFTFRVTKGTKPLVCKYPPTQTDTHRIRTPCTMWVNDRDEIIREIIYPKELWFTTILPDDPIENEIIEISNMFPDWSEIEIYLKTGA